MGNTIQQYNTYLIDYSLWGLFRANETQSTKQWNTTTTTTTTVKNPNCPEAKQLAIYKCSWDVEPGTTRNKFNDWSERVLNPGSPDLKASALTTRPHCLLNSLQQYITQAPQAQCEGRPTNI